MDVEHTREMCQRGSMAFISGHGLWMEKRGEKGGSWILRTSGRGGVERGDEGGAIRGVVVGEV